MFVCLVISDFLQALLVMGFSRQEYWSELPFPTPGDLSDPGIRSVSLGSPALTGGFFTAAAESLQSCPTLCDRIGGSPAGCPVSGILQARTLEWVAISFSNSSPFLLILVKRKVIGFRILYQKRRQLLTLYSTTLLKTLLNYKSIFTDSLDFFNIGSYDQKITILLLPF